MPYEDAVLVIANRTAESDDLLRAMRERAERRPTAFTLLLPVSPGARTGAHERLERAVGRMRSAGLRVEGHLGTDSDPFVAVHDAWDPATYDEVIVATFPTGASHWLRADLPSRVARLTGTPVSHVVVAGRPPARNPQPAHAPPAIVRRPAPQLSPRWLGTPPTRPARRASAR